MYKTINDVKLIEIIPGTEYFESYKIADYFNVSQEVIRSFKFRNKKCIDEDGVITLKGHELKKFKNDMLKNYNYRIKAKSNLTLFTIKSIYRMSFYLVDSMIATKLQNKIMEIKVPDWLINSINETMFNNHLKQKKLEEVLQTVFDGVLKVQRQVTIDNYRVDYIIDDKIIVECDEFGHYDYDDFKEEERNAHLISKNYNLIRYDIDSNNNVLELINCILKTHRNNNFNKGVLYI